MSVKLQFMGLGNRVSSVMVNGQISVGGQPYSGEGRARKTDKFGNCVNGNGIVDGANNFVDGASTVIGMNNSVIGDGHYVVGDNNNITGIGNHVYGHNNDVSGTNNHIHANNANISGNNRTNAPAEKEINLPE